MPTNINSLSAEGRADFLGRLGLFGLDASAIIQPDLVVPPRSKLSLSMGLTNSFVRPHVLVTRNLDDAKKWIGIPNEHFQRGILKARPAPSPLRAMLQPPGIGRVASAAPLQFTAAEQDTIRDAAVSYIWGNSASVANYKSVVEQLFGEFQFPIWIFLTITVTAGSTLVLGPGQNILCCWQITIEEGGSILVPK